MASQRVADLTLEQLRAIIREEIERMSGKLPDTPNQNDLSSDLSDFPVDTYGSWPEGLSLRREDLYGDDQR